MKELKSKHFANGSVYCFQLNDKFLIETTDTFLPMYTKYCKLNTNILYNKNIGSRNERYMIGVSVGSGCPVGCKFCATGKMKKFRNLTWEEIINQIDLIKLKNPTIDFGNDTLEAKINYTRMSDPFLNVNAVKKVIKIIDSKPTKVPIHHYVSTIGVKDSDFSWIKDNITLQISLHSLDESRRNWLIPYKNKMTIKELGQIRTKSNLKTTINLTLVDETDFDINKLKEYFDPDYFFIKLSPINKNETSDNNNMGDGIIKTKNLL